MSRLMIKPTKWHVRPTKTQISLGIRPVWSESSLSAWRKLGSSATHWAHCQDSDQIGRMPRLIRVFAERTCHFVGFVMRRLKFLLRITPYIVLKTLITAKAVRGMSFYSERSGYSEHSWSCREILTQIVRLDGNLYTAGFPWKPILRTRCNGERISL